MNKFKQTASLVNLTKFLNKHFCQVIEQQPEIIDDQYRATFQIIKPNIIEGDYIFETKFGPLKLVRNTFLSEKQKNEINGIYYLVNGVGSNFIRKIFKSEKNAIFLFDCEKMNYTNTLELYNASKKMLESMYFGTKTQQKDPFARSSSPLDTFNLSRRILIEQKKYMSRMNILVTYDGTVRLQGPVPECQNLKYLMEKKYHQLPGYKRYNYMLPFQAYQGLITAYNYEKQGIEIKQLGGKKIYSLYGVWNPTQPLYLEMVDQFFQNLSLQRDMLETNQLRILDIGCGTGVLGFIATKNLKQFKPQLFAIDNNENAVNISKINSQHLEIEQAKIMQVDFRDSSDLKTKMKDNKFPDQYEIIIANPPWITASPLNNQETLENAVYDYKGKFLDSILSFTSKNLVNSFDTNKKGRLLLIYSDLSQILGLQDNEYVQKLCKKYQLVITQQNEELFQNNISQNFDPLQQYKSMAKVIIYEIKKF